MISEQISNPEQTSAFPLIPAIVREYASKQNVGMPLMCYPRKHTPWPLIGNSFLAAYGIILAIFGIPAFIYATKNSTQNCIFWFIMLMFILSIINSSIWSITLLQCYRQYWQKLYLCQDGLLRLGSQKEEAIRWDEVTDMYGSSDRLLALKPEGKTKFVIAESWACNEEISRRIANNLTERLWSQMLERFEAGIPLAFGSLLINSNGLYDRGKTITWEEIENIEEKKGWLMITMRGKRRGWESVDNKQHYLLSDLPLIVALVKHMLRARLLGVMMARTTYVGEEHPEASYTLWSQPGC